VELCLVRRATLTDYSIPDYYYRDLATIYSVSDEYDEYGQRDENEEVLYEEHPAIFATSTGAAPRNFGLYKEHEESERGRGFMFLKGLLDNHTYGCTVDIRRPLNPVHRDLEGGNDFGTWRISAIEYPAYGEFVFCGLERIDKMPRR